MYLENAITARQLRLILFNVQNGDMTVKELRQILFDLPQDEVINYSKVETEYNYKNYMKGE